MTTDNQRTKNCNSRAERQKTKSPIKYLVVIIPENASFDHIFSTYPIAQNSSKDEPKFFAKPNTPTINGLTKATIESNTNLVKPFRLSRNQVATSEPAHHYNQLQTEAHAGLLDRFVETNNGDATCMGFFDGNVVTALWSYSQRFSMSDNCCSTTMTPSTPGHINLISGQTHGAIPPDLTLSTGEVVVIDGTLIGDPDGAFDMCSVGPTVEMTGRNVGDLLKAKKVTYGWFQQGFRDCNKTHIGSDGLPVPDYSPHHNPFQYYRSTANPNHLPPKSVSTIGHTDQANHQYDIEDFWAAARIHNIPSVSFIKPPQYQDGHPRYSNQLLFQQFLVKTMNRLQLLPEWKQMAVVVIFDDSGGFFTHQMPPIINQSQTPVDALVRPGNAGDHPPLGGYQGRLAYGNRIPCLILSPFAKINYVDHSLIDQTSVLRFIEKNWNLGTIGDFSFDQFAGSLKNMFDFDHPNYTPLLLNPKTGEVLKDNCIRNFLAILH